MNHEQQKSIETALAEFIIRVSKGKTTSETETAVLPEVIMALVKLSQPNRFWRTIATVSLAINGYIFGLILGMLIFR